MKRERECFKALVLLPHILLSVSSHLFLLASSLHAQTVNKNVTIHPDVCIHCGSKRNLVPKNVAVFPRCRSVECNKKGDVARRKRKVVTVDDLGGKKKK